MRVAQARGRAFEGGGKPVLPLDALFNGIGDTESKTPAGVLKWDRHWIATVLTAQVAAGAALGIAAQAFLVVVIIG